MRSCVGFVLFVLSLGSIAQAAEPDMYLLKELARQARTAINQNTSGFELYEAHAYKGDLPGCINQVRWKFKFRKVRYTFEDGYVEYLPTLTENQTCELREWIVKNPGEKPIPRILPFDLEPITTDIFLELDRYQWEHPEFNWTSLFIVHRRNFRNTLCYAYSPSDRFVLHLEEWNRQEIKR